MVIGEKLTVGAGDFVQVFGMGHPVSNGSPNIPAQQHHDRPGTDKTEGHPQRTNRFNQPIEQNMGQMEHDGKN